MHTSYGNEILREEINSFKFIRHILKYILEKGEINLKKKKKFDRLIKSHVRDNS